MLSLITLFIFFISLLGTVICFCLTRINLYRYYIKENLADSYFDFNLKFSGHSKKLRELIFKVDGGNDFNIKKIKFFYIFTFIFFIIFIVNMIVAVNYI